RDRVVAAPYSARSVEVKRRLQHRLDGGRTDQTDWAPFTDRFMARRLNGWQRGRRGATFSGRRREDTSLIGAQCCVSVRTDAAFPVDELDVRTYPGCRQPSLDLEDVGGDPVKGCSETVNLVGNVSVGGPKRSRVQFFG